MKNYLSRAICVGLFAMFAFQCVSAQTQREAAIAAEREAAVAAAGDKYVISAKAGWVNLVEGPVSVLRSDGRSGYVTRRDQIAVGDVISTGDSSRAEVLLNPGSFLRVGPNSTFEFETTSLDDLRIKLKSGSAIFEVFASRDFKVRVTTPNAKLLLIKSGVFRIDVTPSGGANIEVVDGEALLGDRNATLLKKGFAAQLSGREASVDKFDRKDFDEFETWSRTRGKDLARQSSKLQGKMLSSSLLNSFNSGGWSTYSSFGLWVFNPGFGSYCFLPFGQGWSSPYGFGYNSCVCSHRLPQNVWNPPSVVTAGSGSTSAPSSVLTMISSQGDRSATPPFMRMEQAGGGRGIVDSGMADSDRLPRFPDTPVYSAPASPSIVVQTAPGSRPDTGSKPR